MELAGKTLSDILAPYQKEGVNFAYKRKRCVFIMGMGTGKTLTTLALLSILKERGQLNGKVLVASTVRIAENVWHDEVAQWQEILPANLTVSRVIGNEKKRLKALTTEADIYTISVDSLEWLTTLPYNLRPFKNIIFDELSLFKNSSVFSKSGFNRRTKAAMFLASIAERVIGLTGTPKSTDARDLFTEYLVVDKGACLGVNRWAFAKTYFTKNEYTGAYTEEDGASKIIEKLIAPITYTIKGVAEERNFSIAKRSFNLSNKVFGLYKCVNNHNASFELNIITDNGLTKFNYLRQLSSGFVYDWQRNIVHTENAKLEALAEVWAEMGHAPVIIFYHFIEEGKAIAEHYKSKRVAHISDEGAIERWRSKKIDILLANPKSAGHGLNLQAGGYNIIFYTMPLSAELFYQAIARLARKGQTEWVNAVCLAAADTQDDEIFEALKDRGLSQQQMIERLANFIME